MEVKPVMIMAEVLAAKAKLTDLLTKARSDLVACDDEDNQYGAAFYRGRIDALVEVLSLIERWTQDQVMQKAT